MKFAFSDQQRLVFYGDSVPCGQGDGFVAQALGRIGARHPDLEFQVKQPDLGDPTLGELLEHLPISAAALNPHWITLILGPKALISLSPADFATQYQALVAKLQHHSQARLILCEPFVLQSDPSDPLRQRIDQIRETVWNTARAHQAILVPFQKPFDRVLSGTQPQDWGLPNYLQLNRFGSALIAEEFLGAIGFEVFDDDH